MSHSFKIFTLVQLNYRSNKVLLCLACFSSCLRTLDNLDLLSVHGVSLKIQINTLDIFYFNISFGAEVIVANSNNVSFFKFTFRVFLGSDFPFEIFSYFHISGHSYILT